jgi:hypothetical protein
LAAASDQEDVSAAASLVSGPWTAFVKLVDVPMRRLQALIGQRNMPYMFLLPNLVFFGVFVFLPLAIKVWYSVTGGSALFLGQRPYVDPSNTPICSTAALISTPRAVAKTVLARRSKYACFQLLPGDHDDAVLAGHRTCAEY